MEKTDLKNEFFAELQRTRESKGLRLEDIARRYRIEFAERDDITFARIGTERGVAIDTFYIEGANHEPVVSPERLEALRSALNEVIAAPVTSSA